METRLLRASKSDSLFEANVPMVGVLDPMTILEVKYDRPLPPWLGRMLSSIPGAPMQVLLEWRRVRHWSGHG